MNILLLGSGGREHALAWKLAQSPSLTKLYAAPGNPGIAEEAELVALDATDHAAVIAFCEQHGIALVVVGPEAPLVDGLADSLDGLWGGQTPERRLEIMKDSRIGAYGVIGLVLTLLLRWQLWALVIGAVALWPVALAVGAVSRAPMAVIMGGLRPARASGVSRHVGQPAAATACAACAIGTVFALLLGWAAPLAVAAVIAVTFGWARIAQRRIGGQTGDILGAAQQFAEIALLLVLATLL